MATPRLGLVVEDKPTELSCSHDIVHYGLASFYSNNQIKLCLAVV